MADGFALLDAQIAKVRNLGRLAELTAKKAAPLVLEAVQKTTRAGKTPDGVPWPAKKDGGQALVHAADHLSASAEGSIVILTLTGKAEVVHNSGDKRNPKRQILPDAGAGLPTIIAEAVRRASAEAFAEIMR